MIFAAIDPGSVHAAIAVFVDATPLFVDDIPITGKMIDGVALAKTLADMGVQHVVIENVHSMPTQGVTGVFNFGMGTGIIHGVVAALRLPHTLVAPTLWKGFHRLDADKEKSRGLALQKWPEHHERLARKKDANRAEALLIGDWFYVRFVVPRTLEALP